MTKLPRLSKTTKELHTLIAVAFKNMTQEQQKATIIEFEERVELTESDFITDFLEIIIENFEEVEEEGRTETTFSSIKGE